MCLKEIQRSRQNVFVSRPTLACRDIPRTDRNKHVTSTAHVWWNISYHGDHINYNNTKESSGQLGEQVHQHNDDNTQPLFLNQTVFVFVLELRQKERQLISPWKYLKMVRQHIDKVLFLITTSGI